MLSSINDAELDIHLEKSESWPLPHSMHKYQFKMNYIPNEKGKTIKLPEEYLHDFQISKDFLNRT